MEMPRSRSIAIQSEVTPRRPALPCTAPAWLMADACSASASVSVDLPASGWLITANVRRRAASSRTAASDAGRFSTSVTDTADVLLTQRNTIQDPQHAAPEINSPERTRGCARSYVARSTRDGQSGCHAHYVQHRRDGVVEEHFTVRHYTLEAPEDFKAYLAEQKGPHREAPRDGRERNPGHDRLRDGPGLRRHGFRDGRDPRLRDLARLAGVAQDAAEDPGHPASRVDRELGGVVPGDRRAIQQRVFVGVCQG